MAKRSVPQQRAIPSNGKHIAYDRLTKDYAMHFDGQFIGYAPTYHDAETTLDRVAYERNARNGGAQ